MVLGTLLLANHHGSSSTMLMPTDSINISASPSSPLSFDWSDFPLVHQFHPTKHDGLQQSDLLVVCSSSTDDNISQTAVGKRSSSPSPPCLSSRHRPHSKLSKTSSSTSYSSTSARTTSTTLTSKSLTTDSRSHPSTMSSNKNENKNDSSSRSKSNSNRRRQSVVTFAPRVKVREYNVVLGDHPYCHLPLSLGWTYSSHDVYHQDYASSSASSLTCDSSSSCRPACSHHAHQAAEATTGRTSSSPPRRTTYAERKHKLLTIGGYTEQELLQQLSTTATTNNNNNTCVLRHVPTAPTLLTAACCS